jgi:hypothetical protein
MQHVIKNCHQEIPKADSEWLVKEHFYSKEFIVSVNLAYYIMITCVVYM